MSLDPELLVAKGLFPENLPPIYTTRSIWNALNPRQTSYSISAKAVGELALYNASKRGGQRRVFAIPHPLFVKEQGLFFRTHWAEIEASFSTAPGSASRPHLERDALRHVRITPHGELPKLRLQRLSRFKFCLVTDVSRFYYSIYTHALPWALNGKAKAKADGDWKSTSVSGNRLDFLFRQAQARQTIGIPVGPDASKIAAEIIMSAVDKRFIERSGRTAPVYVRHVDDYWIGGHTHEECEKHLANLRSALKDFELDINETKTRIISTKHVFGETWPSEFEKSIDENLRAPFFSVEEPDAQKVIATLGRIIERSTEDGDDGIIRHAIRIIDRKMLWGANWEVLEHFLAQCAVQFPHSFDYVARVIAWRRRKGDPVDNEMWIDIAEVAVQQHSALGRDSESCWALWLLKELSHKISKAVSDSLIENCNPFVLAFLAHFQVNKMARDRKLISQLRSVVSGDPFAGPSWPLTLELVHLGEGDSSWTSASTLAPLRTMHTERISIIDWGAAPRVFSAATPSGGIGPEFAIEDIGSDYEELEEEDETDEEEAERDVGGKTQDNLKDLASEL